MESEPPRRGPHSQTPQLPATYSQAALELTRQTVPSLVMKEMFCVFCLGFNLEPNKDPTGGRRNAAWGACSMPPKFMSPKPEEWLGLPPWDTAWTLQAHTPGNRTSSHVGEAPQHSRLCAWHFFLTPWEIL